MEYEFPSQKILTWLFYLWSLKSPKILNSVHFLWSNSFFFIKTLFFGAILGSKQNQGESTEICHIPPSPYTLSSHFINFLHQSGPFIIADASTLTLHNHPKPIASIVETRINVYFSFVFIQWQTTQYKTNQRDWFLWLGVIHCFILEQGARGRGCSS